MDVESKSSKTMTVVKIVIFIGVMIGFYFIIRAVSNAFASKCPSGQKYDEVQKKCVVDCTATPDTPFYDPLSNSCTQCKDKSYQYIDGKCVPNCIPPEEPCGDVCIDTGKQQCIFDSPCDLNKIYYKGTGTSNPFCCDSGWANRDKTGCTDTCPPPNTQCGPNCCDENHTCINDQCCPNENVHDNQCCKNYSEKQKICCPDDTVIKDGDCYIKCSDGTLCPYTKDATNECVNTIYYDTSGKVTKTSSTCAAKDACQLPALIENPPNILYNGNQYPICMKQDKPKGPYATCKVPDIALYTKTYTITPEPGRDVSKCQTGNCVQVIGNNYGIISVDANFSQSGSFLGCEGELSCAATEGTDQQCPDTCPLGISNSQCCNDPTTGKYLGYVCGTDKICGMSQNQELQCYDGIWGGPDTNFECLAGNEGDYKNANKYSSYNDCMQKRCTDYDLSNGPNGCYLSNPPVPQTRNICKGSSTDLDNKFGISYKKNSYSYNDRDFFSCEQKVSKIPYNSFYCKGSVVYAPEPNPQNSWSNGAYIKCSNPNGCISSDEWEWDQSLWSPEIGSIKYCVPISTQQPDIFDWGNTGGSKSALYPKNFDPKNMFIDGIFMRTNCHTSGNQEGRMGCTIGVQYRDKKGNVITGGTNFGSLTSAWVIDSSCCNNFYNDGHNDQGQYNDTVINIPQNNYIFRVDIYTGKDWLEWGRGSLRGLRVGYAQNPNQTLTFGRLGDANYTDPDSNANKSCGGQTGPLINTDDDPIVLMDYTQNSVPKYLQKIEVFSDNSGWSGIQGIKLYGETL